MVEKELRNEISILERKRVRRSLYYLMEKKPLETSTKDFDEE